MGEEWLRVRQVLSKQMLKPNSAVVKNLDFNDITDELIQHLRKVKASAGDEELSSKLPNEFYRWALECKSLTGNKNYVCQH